MFQIQKPPPELLSEMMIRELENFTTFNVQTLHAKTGQNDAEIFRLSLPIYIYNTETHFVKVCLPFSVNVITFLLIA